MLEAVIQNLQRQQRPYYRLQGKPIKSIENQYWLIFRHRELGKPENLLVFGNFSLQGSSFSCPKLKLLRATQSRDYSDRYLQFSC